MPPVYNTTEINGRLAVVRSTIDAGGGHGFCNIYDPGFNLLAQASLLGPPCGVVAGGILTFLTPWVAPNVLKAGTPVSAQITDSTGSIAISGLSVGTIGSTSDIVLSNATLTLGETVVITSAAIVGH